MTAIDKIYEGFGLRVRSNLLLPEFQVAKNTGLSEPVDLTVEVVGDGHSAALDCSRDIFCELVWNEVVRVELAPGLIRLYPAAHVPPTLLNLPFHGPVMATYLQWLGHYVLHAAAIEVDDICVVIAGAKGAGKSTIASSLITDGCRLIADDVCAISNVLGTELVIPAFPQVKVTPNTASIMDLSGFGKGAPPIEGFPKVLLSMSDQFRCEPARLAHIIVVEPGDKLAYEPLNAHERAIALMMHCYDANARTTPLSPRESVGRFEGVFRVASLIPVTRISNPRNSKALGELRDLVKNLALERFSFAGDALKGSGV